MCVRQCLLCDLIMDTLGFEPRAFSCEADVIPLHHVPLGSFRSCSFNGLHGGEDKPSVASHSYQFKHLLPLGKRPCVQFLARPHDVRVRPLQAIRYQKRSTCHCHHRRIVLWAERQALADVQRSSPLPKPPLRKSTTRYAVSHFGILIRTEHVREAPARWEDHVEATVMHCMQQRIRHDGHFGSRCSKTFGSSRLLPAFRGC
jgi:hypothetical protein